MEQAPNNLKKIRESAGISVRKMAKILSYSGTAWVWRMENAVDGDHKNYPRYLAMYLGAVMMEDARRGSTQNGDRSGGHHPIDGAERQ